MLPTGPKISITLNNLKNARKENKVKYLKEHYLLT